ncbi:hypothetical protein ACKC9G_08495 [Pokkaliibacter sp. CJK22405]|uniref:hypothetical protein n=1 Tax=Pokkaliibacter sp. CJK22405 TaxID=3384615 RepID=UPI0039851C65
MSSETHNTAFGDLAIDETQRQAYLEAMGIDVWMPTTVLAGAHPSDYFEWDALAPAEREHASAAPAATTITPPLTSRAPADAKAELQALASQTLGKPLEPAAPENQTPAVNPVAKPAPAKPVTSSAQEPVADTRASTEVVPVFHLAAMAFSRGIVLTDMPTRMKRLSQEHIQLLTAMLSAVTGQKESMATVKYFFWPMVKTQGVDQTARVAQQTLARWLPVQRQQESQDYLIVMGEKAIEQILPGSEEPAFDRLHEYAGWQGVGITHGLHALLNLPELKRDTWQHLQPMVRALKARVSPETSPEAAS